MIRDHIPFQVLFLSYLLKLQCCHPVSLIDDPDKGKNMGETGRKRVEENYSIAMHCEDVANVYQYLLNGNLMTT